MFSALSFECLRSTANTNQELTIGESVSSKQSKGVGEEVMGLFCFVCSPVLIPFVISSIFAQNRGRIPAHMPPARLFL